MERSTSPSGAATLAAAPDATTRPTLLRVIGRWTLTAIVINSVIGSGIFGLPSTIAGLVGAWSPLAMMLAGISLFTVILCFAEVGSRFDTSGGPYLYAREAFGPAVGFHMGWLHVWTRLFSGAALLNVLVAYIAVLLPWLGTPVGRAVVMIVGMLIVTVVNVIGVRQGAWTVNFFTVAKLLPLGVLLVVGLANLRGDVLATQVVTHMEWTSAVLLLVFAYGGFESAAIAAGETRDPKRDTPFAITVAMLLVTVIYTLVQLAVIGVVPNAAGERAPVAAALGNVLGTAGSTLGAVAVVLSVYGWLSGFALATPRILHAMAERGELPAMFARVHPTFRTPHVSILVNSALLLVLAVGSSFAHAATVSVITRLVFFAVTCAALMIFRRRAGPAPFTIPGGPVIPVLGIAFCIYLLSTRTLAQAWLLPILVLAAAVVWRANRRRQRSMAAA